MKLENRTILITGGTSGMGFELAKQLLERRNVVIISGRNQEKLDSAKRELRGVHTFKSDVGDPAAIAALYDNVLRQFPELDTLINNAGIMRVQKFNQDEGLDDITREIEICYSGPVRMIKQFLPHFLRNTRTTVPGSSAPPEEQASSIADWRRASVPCALKTRQGALLVNVSSGAALIPFPISPVYSGAKAALHSFTESLRVQLKHTSVRVVELIPPGVETPLFRNEEFEREMKVPKGMDVKVFAKKAIAGIEAGKQEVRPGLANVLKIVSRIAPGFALKQMGKMTLAFGPKSSTTATKSATAGALGR